MRLTAAAARSSAFRPAAETLKQRRARPPLSAEPVRWVELT